MHKEKKSYSEISEECIDWLTGIALTCNNNNNNNNIAFFPKQVGVG